jgi:magnesium chelatase family protein
VQWQLSCGQIATARLPWSVSSGENCATIRARVKSARQYQWERFTKLNKPTKLVNDDMGPGEVQTFRRLDEQSRQLMKAASQQLELSVYNRRLKLVHAIADLAGDAQLGIYHLMEVLRYRSRSIQ